MQHLELIIIIGNQFVSYHVACDAVKATNQELKRATDTSTWFSRDNVVFARGDAISGWYYREIKPTATDAINRMTSLLEKQANDGESWRG